MNENSKALKAYRKHSDSQDETESIENPLTFEADLIARTTSGETAPNATDADEQQSDRRTAVDSLLALIDQKDAPVNRHEKEQKAEQINRQSSVAADLLRKVKEKKIEQSLTGGGEQKAKQILLAALDREQAEQISQKVEQRIRYKPFAFLDELSTAQIAFLLAKEPAKVAALVLSHLDRKKSAALINGVGAGRQADISRHIAVMGKVAQTTVESVEAALLAKHERLSRQEEQQGGGGIEKLEAIVKNMPVNAGGHLLKALQNEDMRLAKQLKKKLFSFEDILPIVDRDFEKVLQQYSDEEIALLLFNKTDNIKEKFFHNLSPRRQNSVNEAEFFFDKSFKRQQKETEEQFLETIRQEIGKGRLALIDDDSYI